MYRYLFRWLTSPESFVAFISGSFAAVLLLASVIDPDLFVHFEVTPHRTVFFYLGVFGAIMAGARGMVPDDNRVFDPELLMEEVIRYTHYMPEEWKDQLHSKQVGDLESVSRLLNLMSPISTGPPRIWRVVRYENNDLRARARFGRPDAFCALVFPPAMCPCHYRFLPRFYGTYSWPRICLQFCGV